MQILEQAIYAALAYADIFDYPLTASEVHRYLPGYSCTPSEVARELERNRSLQSLISTVDRYYTLSGREQNVPIRLQRAEVSSRLWGKALRYGLWIAALPFVRMVAVTGSLAMDNARDDADIDYLLVTKANRLWTTRAMAILLGRLATRQRDMVCPNYLITEDNLVFPDRSLFTAHEVVQMVPIAGLPIYRRLLALNAWTCEYLPNAQPQFGETSQSGFYHRMVKPALEAGLSGSLASRVEDWEMKRKTTRFSQLAISHPEACFRPDLCKGHLNDHGLYVQNALRQRMLAFEEALL